MIAARSSRSPLVAFIAGALITSVVGYASLGGASGVVIPYSGHLDRNGAPLDALVTIEFDVFNGAADVTPCDTITVSNVLVTGGELATSIAGIDEACVRGKDVFLAVSVDADGNGLVPLNGRQRVFPSLAALTSGVGDFAVGGALTANSLTTGNASITGTLSLSPGSCVSVPDGTTTFLVCGDSGVRVRPIVDPPAGASLFRVTDAAGNAALRVEHDDQVVVEVTNGFAVESASNTAHTSMTGGVIAIHTSSTGAHMEIDGNSIEAFSNSTTTEQPLRLNTGLVVSGGSATANSAPDDPLAMSNIETDAADKLFLADSTCVINALWVGECNTNTVTQACICTCQDTDENSSNRGWYCFN